VHDREYRPQDLVQGEVAIYTDEDATTPFRVQMKRGRIHFRRSDKEDIDIDTSKTEDIGTTKTEVIGTSKSVTVPISTHINTISHTRTTLTETHVNAIAHIINSPEVSLGGPAFVGLRKIIDSRFIDLFNNHVHGGVAVGAGNTGVPTIVASEANQATTKVRAI